MDITGIYVPKPSISTHKHGGLSQNFDTLTDFLGIPRV